MEVPPLPEKESQFNYDLSEFLQPAELDGVKFGGDYFYPDVEVDVTEILECDTEVEPHRKEMHTWLNGIHEALTKNDLERDQPTSTQEEVLSCIPYFSKKSPSVPTEETICALLPLLKDAPNSAKVQNHVIKLFQKLISVVNPSQKLTFITADQPLYALQKILVLQNPELYDKVFLILGSLHIEQVKTLS